MLQKDIELYVFHTHAHTPKEISQAAHQFVRERLSALTGLHAEELRFEAGEHGKPFVKDIGIFFNLSHCREMAAAAFSRSEVGVDIEAIRPMKTAIEKRYFTDSEREYLAHAASQKEYAARFFAVWTAKEAYLKLHGAGLSGGLHFSTANAEGPLSLISSEGFGNAALWQHRLCMPDNGTEWQISVCSPCTATVQFYVLEK